MRLPITSATRSTKLLAGGSGNSRNGGRGQVWLQIEASAVAGTYAALVATARAAVGARMTLAWQQQQPIITDSGMNLGVPYPRNRSNAVRATSLEMMRHHL
ncbi:hypothetical protein [Streptomyces sp. LUP30]|uniref:hypothetical protein n=1 Tax=Streptomyces sp. LUP30 TaxID=1890285 RepID=UPI000851FE9C